MPLFPLFKDRKESVGERFCAIDESYARSVALWLDMYRSKAPWTRDGSASLNLPSTIASELARISTIESEIIARGDAASTVQNALDTLTPFLRRDVELACALGSVLFIPRASNGKVSIECVGAESFYPHSFSPDGELLAVSVFHRTVHGGKSYIRTERFEMTDDGCVITNSARCTPFAPTVIPYYESVYSGDAVELAAVPEWADLPEKTVISDAKALPVALFTMPQAPMCDLRSPMGSSVYARAADLIREADRQFGRLLWEFEGGELAIDASEDVFRRSKSGLVMPVGKERLFRPNLLDSSYADSAMKTFSPALRDKSLINGLDVILARIEDICGLSRGTISSMNYTVRTATEIKDSKQRLYSTVCDIQKQLSCAMSRLCRAILTVAAQYELADGDECEIVCHFNDSIIEDASDERVRDLEEVRAEVMTRDEFRKKWGLD